MINPTGHVFYKDPYDQLYDVRWETVNGLIDITTEIHQPHVWGEVPNGYIKNGVLFRSGIVTIKRQILRIFDGGYEIIAEGASQVHDFIQMNFPCTTGPVDNFIFHLDHYIADKTVFKITGGPRWADPADPGDSEVVWGAVNPDGSPGDSTSTDNIVSLEWMDVWTN